MFDYRNEEQHNFHFYLVNPSTISKLDYAISDFRAYVKSHPGINAEMSIEKGRWER